MTTRNERISSAATQYAMSLSIPLVVFACFALVVSFLITRQTVVQPGYTDAFYYFNAANRLVQGDGLTDAYLWTYIGSPESLPTPSHQYWMPLTSLAAAFGMWIFDAPGNYTAAQAPFALMLAGTACVGYWLGGRLGGTQRHAWVAGLLVLFSGYFTRFWGMTDSFAPYALVGSLVLVLFGIGVRSYGGHPFVWFFAGIFAGLAHLTRADGLLLLLVGWVVIVYLSFQRARHVSPLPILASAQKIGRPHGVAPTTYAAGLMFILTIGYLVVMLPWFLRNWDAIGTPLATGGVQAMWYTSYNDIFNYPPGVTLDVFFAHGLDTFIASRWTAFTNNLGTFVAVEGLIAMTPLMLVGLWARRRDRFVQPFALYALLLHIVMTFVFPFPGYRGGLFHSAAALVPWWAALGVVGLDRVIDWIAQRRRSWKPRTAKPVFSIGLVVLALTLSLTLALQGSVEKRAPALYTQLTAILPDDARLMINDPAQLYFFTGIGGAVIPNASPDVVPDIASRYGITHLLVEFVGGTPAVPLDFAFDFDNPPEFLSLVPINLPGARLYAVDS